MHDATLIIVLGQLRAGYDDRPESFPASVVLCGMRDLSDYKVAFGGKAPRLGSPSSTARTSRRSRRRRTTRDR